MKRKILLLCIIGVILLSGCGSNGESTTETETETEATTETTTVDPNIPPEGMDINPLTGEFIKQEGMNQRPIGVMINNDKKALPQWGIAGADIIYETYIEVGVTRLYAIFSDYSHIENIPKIGPIRSARHYYLSFAYDHAAIFAHHGGSEFAYAEIKKLKTDNIDGMKYDGITYHRDAERRKQRGLEHSSYTTGTELILSTEKENIDTTRTYFSNYKFYQNDHDLTAGIVSDFITVPYSKSQMSQFKYIKDKKIYERYQTDNPHIDDNTGETLAFKNIIIQIAKISKIPGDAEGRRDIELTGTGEAYYITNGKAVKIYWTKPDIKTPASWAYGDGTPLILNKGKTFICVFGDEESITFTNAIEEVATDN